jgi:putative flippase GtrA
VAAVKTRLRSMSVSLLTASGEALLFALLTLVLAGTTTLLLARWVCGLLGAAGNFALNRLWAFRSTGQKVHAQAGRYALTALSAVCLASLAWWSMVVATGWDPRLVHLASMAMVWLVFTFPMMRVWVFRSSG